jgi:hypothetical protein
MKTNEIAEIKSQFEKWKNLASRMSEKIEELQKEHEQLIELRQHSK